MPNLSSVGPTVWLPVDNTYTYSQSPLIYRYRTSCFDQFNYPADDKSMKSELFIQKLNPGFEPNLLRLDWIADRREMVDGSAVAYSEVGTQMMNESRLLGLALAV